MEKSRAEREYHQQIAETIIQQLGGFSRLKAMIGADKFCVIDYGVTFHFKMCRKMNVIKIRLNGLDLYDITFMKYSPTNFDFKEVESEENLYADMLKSYIEEKTGLYLSL